MGTEQLLRIRSDFIAGLIILSSLTVVCNTQRSMGASIRHDGQNIIINGEIKRGDDKKFKEVVADLERPKRPIDGVAKRNARTLSTKPVVYLRSDGGKTVDAIVIGQLVHRKRYQTYAYKGNCLSSCGLIWLAGSKRIIHPKARVGFHNSYDRKTRKAQGNAMVGMYLGNIGFGYDTAHFVTKSNYKNMSYLSRKRSSQEGITYKVQKLPPPSRTKSIASALPNFDPRKTGVMLANGTRYNGDLKNGVPEGVGSAKFKDNSRFSGHWKNGKQHGFGEYWDARGNYFRGTWKNGSRHGFFARRSRGGDHSKSFWENGARVNSNDFTQPKAWHIKFAEIDNHHKARVYRERLLTEYQHILGLSLPYITSAQQMIGGRLSKRRYLVKLNTFTPDHAKFICDELEAVNEHCAYYKSVN